MLFFYIRHGDPIYDPDSLTPLGHEQARAVSKRLALYGLDKIYASTSNRAIQTARPTCDLLKIEPELLDFANESHAWEEMTVPRADGGRAWAFFDDETKLLFNTPGMRVLGDRWYEHPELKRRDLGAGVERVYNAADELFASLGYEHERFTGRYKVTRDNDDKVALFAHAGFGLSFLSCLLDIPYPQFSTHFDMTHSAITVIEFSNTDGYAVPKILTYSNDSHLYKEGLPTRYNNRKTIVF